MVHSFSGCGVNHDVIVKSLKTENWQKVVKLIILEIPYGILL